MSDWYRELIEEVVELRERKAGGRHKLEQAYREALSRSLQADLALLQREMDDYNRSV